METATLAHARPKSRSRWLTRIVYDIIMQQAGNMDHLCDLSYPLLSPPLLHSTVGAPYAS